MVQIDMQRTIKSVKDSKSSSPTRKLNSWVVFLTTGFGNSSLIGITAIFVQLPLFVSTAPEGWRLPSINKIVATTANFGPLLYAVYQKYAKRKMNDSYSILAIQAIALLTLIYAAFYVQDTWMIRGQAYSIPLFISSFLLALKGSSSHVMCMPYMGRFLEGYLVSYFIGEGLSAIVPSGLALLQGVGESECVLTNSTNGELEWEKVTYSPTFSPKFFFLTIFGIMLTGAVCFVLLDCLPLAKKEHDIMKVAKGNDYTYMNSEIEVTGGRITTRTYRFLMLISLFWGFSVQGTLPSIQTFSCLPYGNQTYHLTTILAMSSNALASIAALFLPKASVNQVYGLSILNFFCVIYIWTMALKSPEPWLVATEIGGILMILCWVLETSLNTYIRICIVTIMRGEGGQSLVWAGALKQMGSVTGSIFIFILINQTSIFTAAPASC